MTFILFWNIKVFGSARNYRASQFGSHSNGNELICHKEKNGRINCEHNYSDCNEINKNHIKNSSNYSNRMPKYYFLIKCLMFNCPYIQTKSVPFLAK